MIIDAKGKYGKHLRLSDVVNKEHTDDDVNRKAKSMALGWAPKIAKSFTITDIYKYNYGNAIGFEFSVTYYTTKHEGEHQVTRTKEFEK